MEYENIEHIVVKCSNLQDLLKAFETTTKRKASWAKLYCYAVYHTSRNAKAHGRPYCTPKIIAANILEAFTHAGAFPFQE